MDMEDAPFRFVFLVHELGLIAALPADDASVFTMAE
jgi:hypothetical protein